MSTDEQILDTLFPDEPVKAPLDSNSIAVKVADLLLRYDALEHRRRMVQDASSEIEKQHRASDEWKKKRQDYFRQVWNQQCRKLADVPSKEFQQALDRLADDEYKQCPAKGCFWELEVVDVPEDGTRPRVWSWVPAELASENDPFLGPTLPLRRPLGLPACYAVLAAFHDATLIGVQPIDPWTPSGHTSPSDTTPVFYVILCQRVKELPANHAPSIEVFLRMVEADLKKVKQDSNGAKEKQREKVAKSIAGPELRSWTQSELDAAIREYKAHRSSTYKDLAEGVKQGKPGAIKSALKMFGRNAIARALGVKARAMVSKSDPWQEIARDLKLSRKHDLREGISKTKRIGLDIALENHADEQEDPTVEAVLQNEQKGLKEEAVIRLAKEKLPAKAAAALIEKLQIGETTIDQALQVIALASTQDE